MSVGRESVSLHVAPGRNGENLTMRLMMRSCWRVRCSTPQTTRTATRLTSRPCSRGAIWHTFTFEGARLVSYDGRWPKSPGIQADGPGGPGRPILPVLSARPAIRPCINSRTTGSHSVVVSHNAVRLSCAQRRQLSHTPFAPERARRGPPAATLPARDPEAAAPG